MEQQGAKSVYVVRDDNVVELRTVEVEERFGEFFLVSKGLEAGERIVLEGQLKVIPGEPVVPMAKPASTEPSEPAADETESMEPSESVDEPEASPAQGEE